MPKSRIFFASSSALMDVGSAKIAPPELLVILVCTKLAVGTPFTLRSCSARSTGPSKNHSASSHGSCKRAVGVLTRRALVTPPSRVRKLMPSTLQLGVPGSASMPGSWYSHAAGAVRTARVVGEMMVSMPQLLLPRRNNRRIAPVPCKYISCSVGVSHGPGKSKVHA